MMETVCDIVIIGGGPAGLMAAAAAGRLLPAGSRIQILEKEARIGRKLLATGNGRCNLTNISADPDCYLGNEPRFARGPLHRFSVAAVMSFFRELGLETRTDSEGRVYPWCNQAAAVLDVLRLELHRLNIEISVDQRVETIERHEPLYIGAKPISGAPAYEIRTSSGKKYLTEVVILATGGLAAPKLGSDGSGYKLAEKLGHELIEPKPSLVPICLETPLSKKCSGIRFEAVGGIRQQDTLLQTTRGEFLWTDYGISGIAAMELSRSISCSETEQGMKLELDLLPDMTETELRLWIDQRIKSHPDLICDSLLTGLLHRRLGEEIVKLGISNRVLPTLAVSRLKSEHIDELVNCIKCCQIDITGIRDWDQAQVTAGGLDVKQFKPDSMESRVNPGLFAVGEIVDIDAPCGGYNLQWAWSSGWLAGFKAAGNLLRQSEGSL